MNSGGISLVTGGCGFIGRHLVNLLIGQGQKVRVLDLHGDASIFKGSAEVWQGNILDKKLLREALDEVKVVYHLASIPHLWASNPKDFHQVNVKGTETVLEAARKFPLDKFVYTSSETVLRSWKDQSSSLIDESKPLPQLEELPGPYSKSKLMAEELVMEHISDGLPGIIVYPTIPIGPGDFNLTPPTRMIRDFISGKNPAYMECNLNLVPVQLVAQGHLAAAQKGVIGERYILGQDNYKLSELLAMIEKLLGKKMPKTKIPYLAALASARAMEWKSKFNKKPPQASVEGVRLAAANMHFDCTKSRRELGLVPGSIQDALIQTAQWLEDQELVK